MAGYLKMSIPAGRNYAVHEPYEIKRI